jgi:hypothetical protein
LQQVGGGPGFDAFNASNQPAMDDPQVTVGLRARAAT